MRHPQSATPPPDCAHLHQRLPACLRFGGCSSVCDPEHGRTFAANDPGIQPHVAMASAHHAHRDSRRNTPQCVAYEPVWTNGESRRIESTTLPRRTIRRFDSMGSPIAATGGVHGKERRVRCGGSIYQGWRNAFAHDPKARRALMTKRSMTDVLPKIAEQRGTDNERRLLQTRKMHPSHSINNHPCLSELHRSQKIIFSLFTISFIVYLFLLH